LCSEDVSWHFDDPIYDVPKNNTIVPKRKIHIVKFNSHFSASKLQNFKSSSLSIISEE